MQMDHNVSQCLTRQQGLKQNTKFVWLGICCQTSNISHTIEGNKTFDYSDVVEVSPVGTAPTTSSFSTQHLASITLTPYMVLPVFATRFADYAGGIRVSFIQPHLF